MAWRGSDSGSGGANQQRQGGTLPRSGAEEWDAGFARGLTLGAPASQTRVASGDRFGGATAEYRSRAGGPGAAHCCQGIVSAEDVHRGKPDPEVYLAAASWVGVMPSRCIVVEDAAAGIEGARAAGMRSIGVEHRGQHLAADVAVKSLDLLEAFRQAALRQLAGVDPGSRTDGAAATKRRSIGARRHTTCLRGSRSTRRSRPGWARRCRRSASTRVAFLPAGRRSRVPNRS